MEGYAIITLHGGVWHTSLATEAQPLSLPSRRKRTDCRSQLSARSLNVAEMAERECQPAAQKIHPSGNTFDNLARADHIEVLHGPRLDQNGYHPEILGGKLGQPG